MKKIYLYLFAAAALLACSKVEEIGTNNTEEPIVEDEYVTVGLKGVGEYLTAELTPLTKASSTDLVGIQIKTEGDFLWYSPYGNTVCSKHYGYGVFDSLDEVSFKLKKNHKYLIIADYIIDGKNIIEEVSPNVWEMPFNTSDWSPTEPNKMYYNSEVELHAICNYIIKKGCSRAYCADRFVEGVDRYYGFVLDYEAIEDDQISLDMKRMDFGLTVNLTPDDEHQYDHVVITLDKSKYTRYQVALNPTGVTTFTIPLMVLPTLEDSMEVDFSIGVEDDYGLFFDGKILLYRNKMHTIDFKVEETENCSETVKGVFENSDMEGYAIELS